LNVLSPHSSRAIYSRSGYKWCAVTRKHGSAWLESTPAMDHRTPAIDHGLEGKRICMKSNKREIEQDTYQETTNMDEEHTPETIISFYR